MSDNKEKKINEKENINNTKTTGKQKVEECKKNKEECKEINCERSDHKSKSKNSKSQDKNKIKELKKELELLKTRNSNLEIQILNLKQENAKAEQAFMAQANTFQAKAKEKVEEFKNEHKAKQEQEITHIKKYANSKFFKEIVEPWLNLAIAVDFGAKQGNQDVQNYVVGFQMLLKQMDSIMEKHGLLRIVPSIDEAFNPETMEAISSIEKEGSKDKVIEIKKEGFKHHDRILKPAVVVIGK
ncbi:nucleotide exchange factor GrpE [Mycoplasma marinum]|uniref:Protein GrpE n=1 Tax=Mycoplasma marinum TaxID=1937190 RepID=A0A4R0XNZ1_9MOLU|nr:nucleotide exchange factor GrpE [Mycoplasma marinum]TCG11222.1 nucleotide exchange factor GrpE [Mycoplasma marinum]